jgi:hypothetical protein
MTADADEVRSMLDSFGKKVTANINEEWSRERKQSDERLMRIETQIEELFEELHATQRMVQELGKRVNDST